MNYEQAIQNFGYDQTSGAGCLTGQVKEISFGKLQSYDWNRGTTWALLNIWKHMGWDVRDDTKTKEYLSKLLEDITWFALLLIKSKTYDEYYLHIGTFVKLRSTKAVFTLANAEKLVLYFTELMGMELQSGDSPFETLRDLLDSYSSIKETAAYTKLYKFLMYAISLSLFDGIGLSMTNLSYTEIEQEAMKRKYFMGPDFVHSLLDTIVFLSERGYQCVKTGSMSPIFHSGKKYEEWFNKSYELKRKSQLLTNPLPHGFTREQFFSDLDDQIDKGRSIVKFAMSLDVFEKKTMKFLLNDLEMVRSLELTKKAAAKERPAPFAVLIFGGSSVGKSTFTTILYKSFCNYKGLPNGDEFKYTRNPASEFWDNFRTSQHTIQMDDIAFLNPANTKECDPTLLEVLSVVNNVPYVPPQADLCDKGRTPVQSRFVIATTNSETLNCHQYFACPLAVQRRFPWVIDLQPKPEYTKDSVFLDSTKIPPLAEGMLPNYWVITVKRVVPASEVRNNQRAKLDTVEIFTDINEFISWFLERSDDFDFVQNQILTCGQTISNIEFCQQCRKPKNVCSCLQTGDEIVLYDEDLILDHVTQIREQRVEAWFDRLMRQYDDVEYAEQIMGFLPLWDRLISWWWIFVVFLYVRYVSIRFAIDFVFGDTFILRKVLQQFGPQNLSMWRMVVRLIGRRIGNKIGYSPILGKITAAIVGSYAIYKVAIMIYNRLFKSVQPQFQGGDISTLGQKPVSDDVERKNPWKKVDYVTTDFDVSRQTLSQKNISATEFDASMIENCAHFLIYRNIDGIEAQKPTRGLCIGDHVWMLNNHAVLEDSFYLLLTRSPMEGVSRNKRIRVTSDMIYRYPERDICFIYIRDIPPCKSIWKFFCKENLQGRHKGWYLSRNFDGSVHRLIVDNINLESKLYCAALDCNIDSWSGIVARPTQPGDCGSMLLVSTSFGPIILGIHYMGQSNKIVANKITYEFLEGVMETCAPLAVQSGVPLLTAKNISKTLGVVQHKSPVLFTESGCADVYGSFEGFRVKSKSSVVQTKICTSMVNRGYVVKHGPPVMHGWKIWRTPFLDMVSPISDLCSNTLNEAVKCFTHDILSRLDKEQLSQVFVYDIFTSVNGAAGVTYVDKINRATSMGFPFNKSKKHFLRPLPPQHGLDEPVEFVEEIVDRANAILALYKQGVRYCPIFMGHKKDEATSFTKILAEKTRIFTGAPGDWVIVVRMYTLSVIRLIQNNRMIFEAGPGTIAQSLEWELIRDHLTQFGDSRMIAGDYKSFDKKMSSTLILAAFDIIISICRAAGYDSESLLVLKCIAEDTAFPNVDFNGDLIQFYGSNPSGHPLTVIINGLVNSLYMRYCYSQLSVEKSARNFTKHVALMTYGDDMVAGVSCEAPFFTHTSVQSELAKIGVGYTMADKTAISVPYISISEVSFLKRFWRWDEDIRAYVCPIEEDSIIKSLTVSVRSKTISEEHQALQIIASAVREYFWFGKEIFHAKVLMLKEIVSENNLDMYIEDATFPTWKELYDSFWDSSKHIVTRRMQLQCGRWTPYIAYKRIRCSRCNTHNCSFRSVEDDHVMYCNLHNTCYSIEDAQCHLCYVEDTECSICGLLVYESQIPWVRLDRIIYCADCCPIFEDWGEDGLVQTNQP